jgi:uncharacterized protein YgiM (DUF1202 family)
MTMKISLKILALLALCAGSAWAAEKGVMLKDEPLQDGASASAAAVGKVGKGAAVEILARQGGWTQVRHAGKTGWVRLLSVRKGPSSQADAGAEVAGALALGTTRADPGRVTATAGLRGLNEEQLRAARYDPAQLKLLDGYAVAAPEARQYAAAGGLQARSVKYLPAPANSSGGGTDSGGGFNFMGGN